MAFANDTSPYVSELQGSVLETTTILSQLLRPAGYSRDVISDLAIGSFINNERKNIRAPSNMHLLALKKALLYAIPVIAPFGSNVGITLTTQVSSPAIQYDKRTNKSRQMSLAIGDKIRLVGLTFPIVLVNHLAHDIFPWKFFDKLDYEPTPIDLSFMDEIEVKKTSDGRLYLIKPKHYENVSLFNQINKLIAYKLTNTMDSVIAAGKTIKTEILPTLERVAANNTLPFIETLNKVIPRQIDCTYLMSFYEALHMTANWLLYDQIVLLGFESNEVVQQLNHLQYVKEQNLKVQANFRKVNYQSLLNTRAEKIARERYPYYFDYTDRRALFIRFNRFSIDKLPKKVQNEVHILLEKDLASQAAMLTNKCEHTQHLDSFDETNQYIDYNTIDEGMYPCKLCSYPLICIHKVDLHEAMSSVSETNDNSDQMYWSRQKIINKYKSTTRRRTGTEDTEVSFTFYCKHCGEELGKSNDNIQATIKSQMESTRAAASDPVESMIYTSTYAIVYQNMNQAIVPTSKKAITKLLFDECKDEIVTLVNQASKKQLEDTDLLTRYFTYAFALAGLISININKIKSTESIFSRGSKQDLDTAPESISGGAQLKSELVAALKIIQSFGAFKRIGITDDSIKGMLIKAFKFMNSIFANEAFYLKASTPRNRLEADIKSGPIAAYAAYMQQRCTKQNVDALTATGVNLNVLFNKKGIKPSTHALYTNLFVPKTKESSERGRYIIESYNLIADYAISEPNKDLFTSIVAPPLSEFLKNYQMKQTAVIKAKREVPVRYLPVRNGREYDFQLENYHIAYCLKDDGSVQPHRWMAVKSNNRSALTCKYCTLSIEKATKSNNDKIESGLTEQMMKEAFFELYTLSCPVKDAHVFESDNCTKCNVTKLQLRQMHLPYYKKYSATYLKYRKVITTDLITDANSIMSYAKVYKSTESKPTKSKPDMIKLESLASSLSKLYGYSELSSIAIDSNNKRSLEIVGSYVRLFYSHYLFAKNISIETSSHPDPSFFAFVKNTFFNGVKLKGITLPDLPAYPSSDDADQLLIDLFEIIYNSISKSDSNELIKFIMLKIIKQHMRRQAFNFAKLKSVNAISEDTEMIATAVEDEDMEDEFNMFDGYDISADDMEDNIDGEYDS